jgi:hypothetical protein
MDLIHRWIFTNDRSKQDFNRWMKLNPQWMKSKQRWMKSLQRWMKSKQR